MSSVKCTIIETKEEHFAQFWVNCLDCCPSKSIGVCLVCALKCHQGHKLGPVEHNSFYCDCGTGKLKEKCKCL